jgi:hypothetical protein
MPAMEARMKFRHLLENTVFIGNQRDSEVICHPWIVA